MTWKLAKVQVLLRDLGIAATTEWRQVQKQLSDVGFEACDDVLGLKERQRLFLEVRGELGAEQAFKALLEASPGITAATSWPLAKRQVHDQFARQVKKYSSP